MVLRIYADESGYGSPIVFVLGGFIARAEQWRAFEKDWQEVLSMSPAINAFHMNDAVARGELVRIKAAAGVLRKHAFPAIAVTINSPDYDAVIKGKIGPKLDTPYFPATQILMEEALNWQIDHGLDEPMDFIFDEQHGQSDFLQSIWTPLVDKLPAELKRKFGQRPIHVNDAAHPPIQAADMLAWTLHRIAYCNASNQPYDEFLDGIFEGLTLRHFVWTAEKMAVFLAYVRQRNTSLGRLTFHEFTEASQNRDILYSAHNRNVLTRASRGAIVQLSPIPAKGIGRFLLVHSCPRLDTPHLHRRSEGECLAELAK